MEPKTPIYSFDDVRVDVENFRVLKGGLLVALEPKAFEVLLYLIEHRHKLVGKDELLDAVWKDTFVTQNAMTRVVAQLRKALKDDAREARYIETVPTRGYRFIAAVERIAQVAEPPAETILERSSEEHSPHSTILILVAAVVVLGVAGFVWWRTAPPPRPAARGPAFLPVQFSSSTGLDVGAAFSPDGTVIAYASDRSGSFEIYLRTFDSGAKELQLTNDGSQNLFPAFSPDGRSVAFTSLGRRGIFRAPSIGGAPQRLTNFGVQPVWSPDGRSIVFRSNGSPSLSVTDYYFPTLATLWIVPASGGEPKPIPANGRLEGGSSAPSWSSDGKEIRFVNDSLGESTVWAYRLEEGSLRKLFSSSTFSYSNATFASDGTRMWFVRWRLNGDIGIWQVDLDPATLHARDEPQLLYQSAAGVPRDLALSRDGKRLAFTAVLSNSQIVVQPMPGKGPSAEAVPLTHDVTYRYALVRSSGDGRRVVYTSFPRNGVPRLWVADAAGDQPPIAPGASDEAQLFGAFSPSNDRVFFNAVGSNHDQLRSWNLLDGSSSSFSEIPQGSNQIAFSPDGAMAAFHNDWDARRQVYLQNVATGVRRVIASGAEAIGFPRFSRDGAWISVEVTHASNGGDDIAVLPSSGGPLEVILHADQPSYAAGWMPDNDRILFAGFRDAVWNIYSVSRSTKSVERLTDYRRTRTYVRYPDWLAGDRIVYEFNETKGNVFVADLR